ncbi:MAG TPA: uroporphyrinogen-III C-methyltransferase [Egibacteraceae bacterium]|nr:uroporphyrinogen-III C-methyltransferase [Egibacteraceae bacterium]
MTWPFGGPPAARGTVHLVGGGPGDPGLIGLRAARLLATATVVAYDRLAPAEALGLCAEDCALVDVGKLPDRHAMTQDEINALLVERALAGQAVVRLKGGDPFVLGRGSEEAQACVAAGVPFEVVPAVTAGVAAPAYAGIPVTHRGVAPAFAVVTGHEDPTKPGSQVDYAALAAFPGTLLFYMGMRRLGEIAAALVAAGKPPATPVALVRWGTTARQRTLTATLADIAERAAAAAFSNPAIVVVGDVVALREDIAWYEGEAAWVRHRRPLQGVSVLVPRTRHQASALSERLRALGAEPVEAPTIAIAPARDPDRLQECLWRVAEGGFDWLALTSANGVEAVWEQVTKLGADARLLARVRIAAVGPGTGEALAAHGLRADLVPERYTTRGLADAFVEDHRPARVLLARADLATPTLTEALAAAGWETTEVEAYRTVPVAELAPAVRARLTAGDVDVAAFASSSTVRNFVTLLGEPPDPSLRIASIGPVTSATCRELGLPVDAEADPHDLDGLVGAVVAAAGSRRA